MHPWIRTCFSYAVVVSGVAMQAQGRWNYGYIKNYILQFSGGSHQRFYDYSNDDGNLLVSISLLSHFMERHFVKSSFGMSRINTGQ